MARTLFGLEAAALLLLSALFAHFGRMGAETFALPLPAIQARTGGNS